MRKPIQLTLVLLLSGFVLRALTPAGYMPGSLADGTAFVLCPNSAPGAGLFLQRNDDSAHHHRHGAPDEPPSESPWEFCPFGVAFAPAAPAPEPVPTLDLSAIFVAASAPPVLLRFAYVRAVRARGPPSLAS